MLCNQKSHSKSIWRQTDGEFIRPVLVTFVIRMVFFMVSRLVNGSVKMVWMRDVCLSYFNNNQGQKG